MQFARELFSKANCISLNSAKKSLFLFTYLYKGIDIRRVPYAPFSLILMKEYDPYGLFWSSNTCSRIWLEQFQLAHSLRFQVHKPPNQLV